MKKFLLIALALIVLVVGGLAVFVAMQPEEFKVTRSATIAAPPATVFEQVNDFHRWQAWSPWAKLDPKAENKFDGPSSGKGAKFSWKGNSEVGEGRMTITKSEPNELILIDLEFVKPLESKAITEFKFVPKGEGTEVTWTMAGKNNFVGKAMYLAMNLQKVVGESYEEGLASIKKIAEAEAKKEKGTEETK